MYRAGGDGDGCGEKLRSLSAFWLLGCLDYLLFLVVIPVSGVLFWITLHYAVPLLVQKTQISYLERVINFGCVCVYVLMHLACKSIYRCIRPYARSTVNFFVLSKTYIYVSALCGTVINVRLFEESLTRVPSLETVTVNVAIMVVGFVALLLIKCRPHIASISPVDMGNENTVEDVFLFPYRLFNYSQSSDVSTNFKRFKLPVRMIRSSANSFQLIYLRKFTPTIKIAVLFVQYGFVKAEAHCYRIKKEVINIAKYTELYGKNSRLYTEIFGIASVSSWYGIWTAFDTFVGANLNVTISIVLISYVGLFCTKTVRNITASPFAVITDQRQGYFDVPTLFQWSFHWKKNKCLYVLDSVFSVFIVGTLVILVWRGAWCVLDQTIFPDNYELSGWISLAVGYFVVLVTFVSQSLMKTFVNKYQNWRRLIVLDIYVVISFCGTINIWRGIWILLEENLALDTSLSNCVLLHFFSFFVLVIFNASNTLLVRGVYIDAKENGDDCIEFPCYYFRLRFQEKQKKKTLYELNKLNTTGIKKGDTNYEESANGNVDHGNGNNTDSNSDADTDSSATDNKDHSNSSLHYQSKRKRRKTFLPPASPMEQEITTNEKHPKEFSPENNV